MRGLLSTVLLVAVAGAVVLALTGAGGKGPEKPHYTVELDNAFGIVTGADLKVAGVRAGKITEHAARPEDAQGAGRLRDHRRRLRLAAQGRLLRVAPAVADRRVLHRLQARHATRRSSPDGATIPVEQTASTIPLDLVNNVLRRPYRERLGIILDELGVGVAGRARGHQRGRPPRQPGAARDRQGAGQARQPERDAQAARHRRGHRGRRPRRQPQATSAAGSWRPRRPPPPPPSAATTSPPACAACRPSCASCARRSPRSATRPRPRRPALQNLNASADQLATFLENVKPLSESTQTNLRSLAEASRKGRPAVKAAQPVVAELNAGTAKAARAGQQRRDRARAPQRPQARGREGPALTRRPGLHGLRGGPAVALRPVAGHQHLRQERLHPQDQPLPLQVQRLPEPEVAEGGDGEGPELLQGLRGDPRAQPAEHHDAGPDGHRPPVRLRRRAPAKAETKKKKPATQGASRRSTRSPTRRRRPEAADQGPGRGGQEEAPGKDELRKRAIERLRSARSRRATGDVEKLRKRLEDRLGIQLPKLEDLPKPPTNPQAPTPSFPTPQVPAPSVPNLPTPKRPDATA